MAHGEVGVFLLSAFQFFPRPRPYNVSLLYVVFRLIFHKCKFISLCRGTVEDRFKAGFIKTLCFDPSRTNTHPLEIRCCIKTRRFMNRDYHATLNCSRTTLPFVSLRLSILFTEKIRRSASFRFSFVSLRVLPCVFTPGISSTQPKYHLPLFLYTAVNC